VSRERGLINVRRQDETEKFLNKLASRHSGARGLVLYCKARIVPPNRNNLHDHNAPFLHIGAFSYVNDVGESGKADCKAPSVTEYEYDLPGAGSRREGKGRRIGSQITPSRQSHNRLDTK
jgi:hypothetical protein